MQRAVDYFTAGKVVCKDFQTAMKLHRQLGCKSIVTLDGTDFKPGMVSGGQHNQNVFDLNLGQAELDRDIKRIQTHIQKLDEQLTLHSNAMKEAKATECKNVRDLNLCENEIMQLEQHLAMAKSKITEIQTQKQMLSTQQSELEQSIHCVDQQLHKL